MTATVQIKHRWTGKVQFECEVDAAVDAPWGLRLGLAVRIAHQRGADLSDADLRGADLSGAVLRGAYLSDADLSGADLSDADLRGAYLRGAYLSGAVLRGADLSGAYLRGAYLRGADLSDADLSGADLSGAPVIEDIHAKVYAAATARPELFDMSTFAEGSGHTCDTAQCRAGWVLAVAGREGLDLEAKIGTPAAAMAIYLASDPERWKTERLPDFYNMDNAAVLADMARMAGVSA